MTHTTQEFSGITAIDLTGILIHHDIGHLVQSVFNFPVSSNNVGKMFGCQHCRTDIVTVSSDSFPLLNLCDNLSLYPVFEAPASQGNEQPVPVLVLRSICVLRYAHVHTRYCSLDFLEATVLTLFYRLFQIYLVALYG